MALTARPDQLRSELVDFDGLFPPSPTRDYLMQNCMGCHGLEHIPWQRMQGGTGREPTSGAPPSAACLIWTARAPSITPVSPR